MRRLVLTVRRHHATPSHRDVSKVHFLVLFTLGGQLTGRLCVVARCVRVGGEGGQSDGGLMVSVQSAPPLCPH